MTGKPPSPDRMTLRVYDTRSREKRELATLEDGSVRMYVCGITPYSPSHLGHARCYLAFDVVHRWLEASGYEVDYVQNFTDIDDKILDISNSEGVDYSVVANRNIDEYFEVMDAMNVLRADHYPRVTETITEIIEMVSTLVDKGHAYVGGDGVYFEIDTAPEKYGQLTGQTLEPVRADALKRPVRASETTAISRFGSWPSPESPHGTARGVLADRVGTSSARRCLSSTSASSSTSTAAATTYASRTTRQRYSSLSPAPGASRWLATGCTTASSTWTARR